MYRALWGSQNFGFYPGGNEKPLEEYEQSSGMICVFKRPTLITMAERPVSQTCMLHLRKMRDQRSLPDAWPARVGLLLLKMRKTIEGANGEGELGEWLQRSRNLVLDMPT